MSEADISQWESVFDELVVDLQEAPPSERKDGQWLQAIAEFSRHSFARLLLWPKDDGLDVRLELALGPTDGETDRLRTAVQNYLVDATDGEWDTTDIDELPWQMETTLGADERGADDLRHLLLAVLHICDQFDSVDSAEHWLQVLSPQDSTEDAEQTPTPASSGEGETPFESIGRGDPASGAGGATIESTASTTVDDEVRFAIGFREVLSTGQIDALQQGLDHHLHTKFDVQTHPVDDDRPELGMPSSARTVLVMAVTPGDSAASMGRVEADVAGFLERLEKFASFGIDLFEYLGVGETVLTDADAQDNGDAGESQLSFQRRAPSSERWEQPPPEDDGIVLDLTGEPAPETAALEAKNYTDPRLQRDDADTPLVDLVLRHPGYSDRRIGQVLSILLSIDYHDAVALADAAPCVIAWGIGQQRARSFKEVIESAGGKVLLVEPDTFEQA